MDAGSLWSKVKVTVILTYHQVPVAHSCEKRSICWGFSTLPSASPFFDFDSFRCFVSGNIRSRIDSHLSFSALSVKSGGDSWTKQVSYTGSEPNSEVG